MVVPEIELADEEFAVEQPGAFCGRGVLDRRTKSARSSRSTWPSMKVFTGCEEAVKAWRNVEHHRQAKAAGRGGVLRDYRLRVAAVVRDYGMTERAEAPADSRAKNG